MRTLNEMVAAVTNGARDVNGEVMIDGPYRARCYKIGNMIRIDLRPITPIDSKIVRPTK